MMLFILCVYLLIGFCWACFAVMLKVLSKDGYTWWEHLLSGLGHWVGWPVGMLLLAVDWSEGD